ncbi:hypothetical protein DFH29DRAFT_876015 [Suillus ampliporus]|nr:hypothetical protein DFH29DRAFT_876015 [Suillus ampliporus]
MDQFSENEYAAEREQNQYFPFASKLDWETPSFILQSDLSMADIDEYLNLEFLLFYPAQGDHAWNLQLKRPQKDLSEGTSLLGVVLSSDKTKVSNIAGNHYAHPLLVSLTNINPDTPEELAITCTTMNSSPVTMATCGDFGDPI